MTEYIAREAFLADKRAQYCANCKRRYGIKRNKYVELYEIGEAPCRSCGIGDVLDDVEDYPAADVVEVVRCGECANADRSEAPALWCEGRGWPMQMVPQTRATTAPVRVWRIL